jgi:hypothetical protein
MIERAAKKQRRIARGIAVSHSKADRQLRASKKEERALRAKLRRGR